MSDHHEPHDFELVGGNIVTPWARQRNDRCRGMRKAGQGGKGLVCAKLTLERFRMCHPEGKARRTTDQAVRTTDESATDI